MAKGGWFTGLFGSSNGAVKRVKKRRKIVKKVKISKQSQTKLLSVRPQEIKRIEDSIRETINWLYVLNEVELDNQKKIDDEALHELKSRLLEISRKVGSLGGPVI